MTDANPLTRYLVPVRRWWPIIAGAVVLSVIVAWITLPSSPQEDLDPAAVQIDPDVSYQATHILVRDRPTTATANFALVVLLARQGDIAAAVEAELGDQVAPGSIEAVELLPDDDLGTLSITSVQPTADLASRVATTYAEAIVRHFDERADEAVQEQIDRATQRVAAIDERSETLIEQLDEFPEGSLDYRLIESELTVLLEQYGQLQSELQDLTSREVGAGSTFQTLQEPVPLSTAAADSALSFEVPTDSRARFALATLLALLLGIGLVLVVDRLDTRLRTREEAEEAFGLPVIAEVPRLGRRERAASALQVRSEPGSVTAEAFRSLRLSIQLATRWQLQREAPTADGPVGSASAVDGRPAPRAILISSPITGEGKSTVVANLAASIAESGERVLVVDCDFRRSTLGTLLGAAADRGLHDLSDLTAESVEGIGRTTNVPGVALIPSGLPGSAPGWFLSSARELVELTKGMADVVIFDTGPLLATNEASALTPHVDAVLVVGRSGRTSREHARRATEQLTRLHALVAGIVFVGAGASRTYTYYEPLRRAAAVREAMKR